MVFTGPIWLWIGFNAFVLAMLALDLSVFHRTTRTVSLKEAQKEAGTPRRATRKPRPVEAPPFLSLGQRTSKRCARP
jgi:hypothetical protein